MLAIRMQRTGRSGHAMFRVIVQDTRRSPTSGRVVAALGSYDPHTKTAILAKEQVKFYLEHGAQPSERAARLLKSEGVKLPSWVSEPTKKAGAARHPEKLRKNQPKTEASPVAEPAEEAVAEPAEASAEPVAAGPEAQATNESVEAAEPTTTEEPAAETKDEPAADSLAEPPAA